MFFAKYFAGSVKIFPLTYELFRCMFFIPKHKGFGDYLLGIDFFFKKVFLDFVNLQCGDIIKLGSKVDNEMEIYVGNLKKFKALPGSARDSYAVRVTQVLREEE